jgi:dipeptidase E
MNEAPVVGLREGAILDVGTSSVLLRGVASARVFRRGQDPVEYEPGARLDFLL